MGEELKSHFHQPEKHFWVFFVEVITEFWRISWDTCRGEHKEKMDSCEAAPLGTPLRYDKHLSGGCIQEFQSAVKIYGCICLFSFVERVVQVNQEPVASISSFIDYKSDRWGFIGVLRSVGSNHTGLANATQRPGKQRLLGKNLAVVRLP
jgi:hypothetical protein